jgi:predicted anti-sigma-YlaC factor YlaD
MSHLSEETLNEYLDNALAPSAHAAADAHLAACAACMAELKTLRSLFAAIESLPEAALERDISAAVVARLGQRAGVPRVIRWALAGQALAVAVILLLAWPLFDLSAMDLPILLDLPSLTQLLSVWAAQQDAWVRAIGQINVLPSFSLPIDPSSATLLVLMLVSACLLWLVGNGLLLLLPRSASLKRRNS